MPDSVLFRTPGDEPSMEPWAVGAFASGHPAIILDSASSERPTGSVVAICGGPKRYRGNNAAIVGHYQRMGIHVLMIESSPLSRHQLIFMNSKKWLPPAPPDAITRRVEQGLVCWPQERGHNIVVLGQGADQDRVLEPYLLKLSHETTRPMLYRRHPNDRRESIPDGCDTRSLGTSLDEDLSTAWAVITHSSGAARDALLRGIPVFCHEEAQFKWVARPLHELWNIEDQEPETPAGVHQFMDRFSAIQWGEDEITDGRAFKFFHQYWSSFKGWLPNN